MNERISHAQLIQCLRDNGWKYSRETKRVEIHKKKGSAQRIDVPKRDYFSLENACIILQQAGLTRERIEEFKVGTIKASVS